MCQWFISLAHLEPFSAARWNDSGADTHHSFILGKATPTTRHLSKRETTLPASQPSTRVGGATGEQKSAAIPKKGKSKEEGKSKGKGQGSKGQAAAAKQQKEKDRAQQQPVSSL